MRRPAICSARRTGGALRRAAAGGLAACGAGGAVESRRCKLSQHRPLAVEAEPERARTAVAPRCRAKPDAGAAIEGLKAIVLLANGADTYAPELLARAGEHDVAAPTRRWTSGHRSTARQWSGPTQWWSALVRAGRWRPAA
ncbi:hypothetical protein I552_7041 [Mycobacterium xenopi 3993]|nr:hypothetical protein I552_7041 [Mycobacterium xenopi 3993]